MEQKFSNFRTVYANHWRHNSHSLRKKGLKNDAKNKVENEQTLFFFVNSTFKYSPITKLAPEQTVILFWRHSGVEGEE